MLSILCVTRGGDDAMPLLDRMADTAKIVGAEFVLVVDGPDNYGKILRRRYADIVVQVNSKGYIESVLDEAVSYCRTPYILRLDDDEACTPEMVEWLADRRYRQHPHWKFPRLHLWPTEEQAIAAAPLWPDHQTRLSTVAYAGGRGTVHAGSPYGGGELAPVAIQHHKFLIKTYSERKRIAQVYDSVHPGYGTGGMLPFSLPEDAFSDKRMDIVQTSELVRSARLDTINVSNLLLEAYEVGMFQHQGEIEPFANWLLERKLENVLEIGTLHGGTSALWHGISTGRVVSIDLPSGSFGGAAHNYDDEGSQARKARLESRYVRFTQILGDSHKSDVQSEVASIFPPESVDLLFIDGDHTLAGVTTDFYNYKPLVRKGGVIAFHDILDTAWHRETGCEVDKLWRELKLDYKTVEFVVNGPWGGIGAVILD